MANFETFTRRTSRRAPSSVHPWVTIQRSASMSLNDAAFKALGEPAAVELLYDEGEKTVGFRAVPPSTGHAYPVRQMNNNKSGSYVISGLAFTRHHRIDTSIARRWTAHMQGDILCVDTRQEPVIVTGNRRGQRADPNRAEVVGRRWDSSNPDQDPSGESGPDFFRVQL